MKFFSLRFFVRSALIFIIFGTIYLIVGAFTNDKTIEETTTLDTIVRKTDEDVIPKANKVIIPVPYISEAPEGDWSGNWVNACEEATIAMVEAFYMGEKSVSIASAKATLLKLFKEEDELYGSNKNADAKQIQEIITFHSSFNATIKSNPTQKDIKNEIDEGRPVISLHRGFDLKNPNIPFSPTKSSYHTVVIVGYDDVSKEYITHDPGDDTDGPGHRYDYDLFMNSIHDYTHATDKADGIPKVIFTSKK